MLSRFAVRAGRIGASGTGNAVASARRASRQVRAKSSTATPAAVVCGRAAGWQARFSARSAGVSLLTATASVAALASTAASAAPATTPRGKPQVIFVLGGPGAGKGTQCGLMVEKYGFVHLSAGDLLRAERDSGSKNGALIQGYISEGKIVPVEITVNLIKTAMMNSGASLFLIDGFPRNFDNLQGWHKVMGDDVDVQFVLFYDTSEHVMEKRLLARGQTSGRSDDNAAVIRKRFNTYLQSTMPVVDVFAKEGKVRHVASTGPVEEVFEETQRVVEPVVKAHVLDLNQRLLDAISAGDADTYAELCAPNLTAFEAETKGHLIEGLDFHNTYLKAAAKSKTSAKNFMSSPQVKLLGDTAITTCIRLVQTTESTASLAETRVWHRGADNKWRHVHFHRSPTESGL